MAELSGGLIEPPPSTPGLNRHLLVVVDKLTKFVQLFLLRVPTKQVTLEWMLESHGFPESTTAKSS